MEKFLKWFDDNLPPILSYTAMGLTVATFPLAVRAGMKTQEEFEKLDDDADVFVKIRVAGKYYVLPLATLLGALACEYGANKEYTKRYVALAGTLALTQKDNKYLQQFKEKAEEKLGVEKTNEVKKETNKAVVDAIPDDRKIWIHDLETGYIFPTTKKKFFAAVRTVNEWAEDRSVSMGQFYMELLGDEYEPASFYDCEGFGKGTEVNSFRPTYGGEVSDNLDPVVTIDYPHASLTNDPPGWY